MKSLKYPEEYKRKVEIMFPNCPKLMKLLDANDPEAGIILKNLFETKRRLEVQKIELTRIHNLILLCLSYLYRGGEIEAGNKLRKSLTTHKDVII